MLARFLDTARIYQCILWVSYHHWLKNSSKLTNVYYLFFRACNATDPIWKHLSKEYIFQLPEGFPNPELTLSWPHPWCSRCQDPHGARGVSEGCRDTWPPLSVWWLVTVSVQLNQSRTFLLLPKDSPLRGGFPRARLAGSSREQSQRAVKLGP